jgi:hypothetical protein
MASTAAGHAYVAALEPEVGDALLAEMEREMPDAAQTLRPRLASNRQHLEEHGYVTACGLWSPHINGLALPLWSPQYQTYVVLTIGLLSAMYDEKRLHEEVARPMLELGKAVGALLQGAEADVFNGRIERKPLQATAKNNHKNNPKNLGIARTEETNDLEAGARRTPPARSLRAGDGRR